MQQTSQYIKPVVTSIYYTLATLGRPTGSRERAACAQGWAQDDLLSACLASAPLLGSEWCHMDAKMIGKGSPWEAYSGNTLQPY